MSITSFDGVLPSSNMSTSVAALQSAVPQFAAFAGKHPWLVEPMDLVWMPGLNRRGGQYEVGYIATQRGRAAYDDGKAGKAQYLDACRRSNASPNPDILQDHDRNIARLRAALDRAHEDATVATNANDAERTAVNAALKLLNDLARDPDAKVKRKVVSLPKGRPADVVKQARATIRSLGEEAEDIKAAPPSGQTAENQLLVQLAQLAEAGEPKISVSRDGASLRVPLVTLRVGEIGGVSMPAITDSAAFIAWLHRDQLTTHIKAQVAERYRNIRLALDPLEKREHLTRIAAQRLEAERIECAAILAAREAGEDIPLRKGTSPYALLGIE